MGTIKSGEQTRLLTRKRIGDFFVNTYHQHDVAVSGKANETKKKKMKKCIFALCYLSKISLCLALMFHFVVSLSDRRGR